MPVGRKLGLRPRLGRAPLVSTEIDEHPPDPAFEAALTAEVEPRPDRAGERLLHCVSRTVLVAERGTRDSQEAPVTPAVHVLDLADGRP